MANTSAISQIGGAIAGSGANTTGIPTGGGNPPGAVTAITVTGFVDPVARECFLTITFTAPTDPSDTFTGVHIYLDIPDHGDGSTQALVGSNVGSMILPGFSPIDLGIQANPQQPWNISFPFPENLGLNINESNPARLYVASVSVVSANQLIQDGQPNATPNQAFALVPTTSGQPTAGTNITTNCGTITCQALPADTSTGKSMSPFLALMGSVPSNPPKGWGYRLYIYTGTGQPSDVSSMVPLTDVCTTAGIVPAAKADLVTDVLNSFAVQTPGATTQATVYAVAGLVSGTTFTANNVIPGITNSCLITLGSSSGTIDAAQAMASSLSAEMNVILGKLGLTAASVGAGFLAPGAAQTNLGVVSATTIIAANTVTGSLLATTGIITSSAQIGTAVIAAANIGSCNVSSLLAGTATFSSTVLFQNSSGPFVEITSTQVQVGGGSYTIGVNSSTGISIGSSSASLAITTDIALTSGSFSATLSASSLVLAYSGGPNLSLFSSSIYLTATANDYVEILAGQMNLVSNGVSSELTSAGLSTPSITVASMTSAGLPALTTVRGTVPVTHTSAASGTYGVPTTCALFVELEVLGTVYLVPAYVL